MFHFFLPWRFLLLRCVFPFRCWFLSLLRCDVCLFLRLRLFFRSVQKNKGANQRRVFAVSCDHLMSRGHWQMIGRGEVLSTTKMTMVMARWLTVDKPQCFQSSRLKFPCNSLSEWEQGKDTGNAKTARKTEHCAPCQRLTTWAPITGKESLVTWSRQCYLIDRHNKPHHQPVQCGVQCIGEEGPPARRPLHHSGPQITVANVFLRFAKKNPVLSLMMGTTQSQHSLLLVSCLHVNFCFHFFLLAIPCKNPTDFNFCSRTKFDHKAFNKT